MATTAETDLLDEADIYDDELDEMKPGWQPLLDDILGGYADPDSENHIEYVIAALFKDYLLSNDDGAAALFAHRFDELYSTVYEPKFNGYRGREQGWTGYLLTFYGIVFRAAVQMQYDDPKQDKVIHLMVELSKLPTRAVKIFVKPEFEWVDAEVWTRDPLLPWQLVSLAPVHDLKVKDSSYLDNPDNLELFQRAGRYFVNFYAFQARCTAAGLDAGFKHRFDSMGRTIATALQPGFPESLEPKPDYLIMAAAQCILIAGEAIDAECVKTQLPPHRHHSWKGWANGNGPKVWRKWGTRLAEIADALQNDGELDFKHFEKSQEPLKDMVIKARDKVLALEPELFAQSDLEPETEAPLAKEADGEPEGEAEAKAAPTSNDAPALAADRDPETNSKPTDAGSGAASPPKTSRLNRYSGAARDFAKKLWK